MGDRPPERRLGRARLPRPLHRGKLPAKLISWGLGAPAGLGHNNGPPIEDETPGYLWRRYRWKKAHADAWKFPSATVAKLRVARAAAAGLSYDAYVAQLLDSGRFAQARDADADRLTALAQVRKCWTVALSRLAPAAPRMPSAIVLASLIGAYDEDRRTYHNIKHVAAVLTDLARHGLADADDGDALVMAALFHDIVYDASRSDNEVASARVASLHLTDLGAAPQRIACIVAMIEATRHRPEDIAAADADTALLLDCDLATLAAAPTRYQQYAVAIRREYAHVPDDAFRAGRAKVLRGFLARSSLFTTPRLADLWERAARTNLVAECERLER